ncbi:helix-turn-helix domain-containing protein [Streptococcus suis]|uniref:helix-turn-helix domain-containing protein n=1 Tax=Streptococcus suis TaxID=1307 RepID=UPI003BA20231
MNRLKELRQEKKLSQKELAKKIGVHYRTLQNWENGESQIKPDKAQALADHFKVSVGYLLGYSTVGDVMELTTKVMTKQMKLEDIPDENTRKAVSNYINLNKGLDTNKPFKTDYSMLNAIEKIDDIKLIDEMITDSMLANRILDRLRGYLMQSGIIDMEYNWEIERVMGWLIDLNDELFKQKISLTGGRISSTNPVISNSNEFSNSEKHS